MPDRLSELRVVDPVLTTLATGYANEEYAAEALFPLATVVKEAGKIPKFGKEAFRKRNSRRAIRAKSNRINPEGRGTVDFATEEFDLEYPIDYREMAEDLFNLEANGTLVVTEGIQLEREIAAADLAQDADTFPTGNKVTLSGTDKFSDKENSDPVGVIQTAKDAVRSKIVKYPNTMILGPTAYTTLRLHPQLIEKIKYSQKGIVTVDLMKEIFEVDRIVVGKAVWADEDDDSFNDVWGDNIVLAYVPPAPGGGVQRSVYEPSFGYTLRLKGHPQVDTYDEAKKLHLVRSTDNYVVVITGADAGYLIKDVA